MNSNRILITVTDKRGLAQFKALTDLGWEIVSTGGTAKELTGLGIPCKLIEDVTGFPELMDGRLKTLHPLVFGAILANRDKTSHMEQVLHHRIPLVDIVAVNLYKFGDNPNIENIDIGGPSLIRAAAKNGRHVTVIVDPDDYELVIDQIITSGQTTLELRGDLAAKAFLRTAQYDQMIASWFNYQIDHDQPVFGSDETVH